MGDKKQRQDSVEELW